MKILITGGCGFIGSHLADKLIDKGYEVRILDNLNPQVHNSITDIPIYMNKKADIFLGDIRDSKVVKEALVDVDAVFHFAAMVGVGQSMYEIKEYTDVNNAGTAVLLEAIIKNPVKRLIVASSMSLYGEGLYINDKNELDSPVDRTYEQLKNGDWEVLNDEGDILTPIPTPETKHPNLASIYALSKFDQEKMSLITGRAYNIPTIALRFFNVYGTRQALSNPYTGVLAIFAARLLNNNPPLIFEDGNQKRDFVSVHDVARACLLALENDNCNYEVFNIGSGNSYTVKEIADKMTKVLNKDIAPLINGKYRVGDIRHCFADISKAKKNLNYTPAITFEDGMMELADWLKNQKAVDKVNEAQKELYIRGLTV